MFLYFLPKTKAAKPDVLERFGLSELFDGKPATREMMGLGPGDQAGLLICNGHVDQVTLEYLPKVQTWQKRFDSDAWMGIANDAVLSPKGLARPSQIDGHPLQLADGNRWLIPQLRAFSPTQLDGPLIYVPKLKRTLTQDPETGDLVPGDVIAKYSAIWKEATEIGDRLLSQLQQPGATIADLPDAKLYGFASRVLALNYRMGNAEIAMANLLQTDMAVRIVQLALDWDTLRANLGNRLRRATLGTPTPSDTTPAASV